MDDRVSTTSVIGGNSDTRRFVYAPDGRVIGEYGTTASDVKAEFIWASPEVGDGGTFGGDDGTSTTLSTGLGGYMPLAVAAPWATTKPEPLMGAWRPYGLRAVMTDASGIEHSFPSGYAPPHSPAKAARRFWWPTYITTDTGIMIKHRAVYTG